MDAPCACLSLTPLFFVCEKPQLHITLSRFFGMLSKKGGYFLTGAKFEHVPLCLGPKKPLHMDQKTICTQDPLKCG